MGDTRSYPPVRPRLSVEELRAAKNTQPIRPLDDLVADTFESDQELDGFLAFTHAEPGRSSVGFSSTPTSSASAGGLVFLVAEYYPHDSADELGPDGGQRVRFDV
ncbi:MULTISPECIES: hypothetical protein [Streptomyces]|uniref:hypothetical protein n=1 Tax=Streptomyces lycopersici TaxID=2974589 RepID=UPI0021D3E34A|nr:hypothetical protein [Streptomyces sp. NEAU-383]